MTTDTASRTESPYLMGRSDRETHRLIASAEVLRPFTRQVLLDAGLTPGMRVLDVGTGAGDVALLAAEIVGRGGSVVGVDANPQILRTAFERTQDAGLDHVSFVTADVRDAVLAGPFDAVVGRFVVMYLPDPAAAVRELAARLAPGGIVAFQEYNFTADSIRQSPPTPLWQRTWNWTIETIARAGLPSEPGFGLRGTFRDAGLREPTMRLSAYVGGGPDSFAYTWAAESLRSMLPLTLKLGVASADEVDIDTLADRLRAETVAADGVVKAPDLVGAWTTVS
jgi:SAM-dependent methyltransferase